MDDVITDTAEEDTKHSMDAKTIHDVTQTEARGDFRSESIASLRAKAQSYSAALHSYTNKLLHGDVSASDVTRAQAQAQWPGDELHSSFETPSCGQTDVDGESGSDVDPTD